MQPIRQLLAALLLACAVTPAMGQTIKTLGYNTTNGQIVYGGTNELTFTNVVRMPTQINIGTNQANIAAGGQFISFASGDGNTSMLVGTNLITVYDAMTWSASSNAATTRANLGFSTSLNTLWSATNASNARSAIGLDATNAVTFKAVKTDAFETFTNLVEVYVPLWIGDTGTNDVFQFEIGAADQAKARTNLGLPLAALTNTSSVTMMRALSGSTNTNHPYSGSISVTGTNNTNTLVFSNGILQSVQ